jgi:hypothetical protein
MHEVHANAIDALRDEVRSEYAELQACESDVHRRRHSLGRKLSRAKREAGPGKWLAFLADTGIPQPAANQLLLFGDETKSEAKVRKEQIEAATLQAVQSGIVEVPHEHTSRRVEPFTLCKTQLETVRTAAAYLDRSEEPMHRACALLLRRYLLGDV